MVRIRFSGWLNSGYAPELVLLSAVIVTCRYGRGPWHLQPKVAHICRPTCA